MKKFDIKQYITHVLKASIRSQVYVIYNNPTKVGEPNRILNIWMPDDLDKLVVMDNLIETGMGMKNEILYNSFIPDTFDNADILFRDLLRIRTNEN